MIDKLKVNVSVVPLRGGQHEVSLDCPNEFTLATKLNEVIELLNKLQDKGSEE